MPEILDRLSIFTISTVQFNFPISIVLFSYICTFLNVWVDCMNLVLGIGLAVIEMERSSRLVVSVLCSLPLIVRSVPITSTCALWPF